MCKSKTPDVFKAHTGKNIWNCFAGKGCTGGNILDLVMKIEGTENVREAAILIGGWFELGKYTDQTEIINRPTTDELVETEVIPNRALGFELTKLDSQHPTIIELGLKKETIDHFKLGWCSSRGLFNKSLT